MGRMRMVMARRDEMRCRACGQGPGLCVLQLSGGAIRQLMLKLGDYSSDLHAGVIYVITTEPDRTSHQRVSSSIPREHKAHYLCLD